LQDGLRAPAGRKARNGNPEWFDLLSKKRMEQIYQGIDLVLSISKHSVNDLNI